MYKRKAYELLIYFLTYYLLFTLNALSSVTHFHNRAIYGDMLEVTTENIVAT
jgi:hypothetical protein